MRAYHLKTGILISLCIAVILSLRQLIWLGDTRPEGVAIAILYNFLFPFCCWLLHQFLLQTTLQPVFLNRTWVKFLIGLAIGLLLSHLTALLFKRGLYLPVADGFRGPRRNLFFSFRGAAVSSIVFFIVYYYNMMLEAQRSRMEIARLQQENLEARLNSLKQQVSPHFLFNSLSTLKTMATDDATRQYIVQLSNVYRYLLCYNDSHLATLEDELDFTNAYLYILQERFERALQVEMQVDNGMLQRKIPPLALQMLIENAVKHNVVSAEEPLHIRIYPEKDHLLVVENTLRPKMSTTESTGKGLQNINDRYYLLAGEQIGIQVRYTEGKFIVKLPLLA